MAEIVISYIWMWRRLFDRKPIYRKLIDMAIQKHQITEPVWRVRARRPEILAGLVETD